MLKAEGESGSDSLGLISLFHTTSHTATARGSIYYHNTGLPCLVMPLPEAETGTDGSIQV